jgi:hypothetical protein
MVEAPVWAKRTGTTEPTERCLVFAVVVSISSWPAASAGVPLPAVTAKIIVWGRLSGDTAVRLDNDLWKSNCPLNTVETAVTPGTRETTPATEPLKPPAPELALVMM